MKCDWANKVLEFEDEGKPVVLTGICNPPKQEVLELSAAQLHKWLVGNEVWALVVLEQVPSVEEQHSVADQIQAVVDEFQDIFEDPKQLPPSRHFDHHIPLIPGAIPVNSRPYRYSPFHKNEIERQVTALLESGLIVPSVSPLPHLFFWCKEGWIMEVLCRL